MQLSELSYREYIALEVLPSVMLAQAPDDAAAYTVQRAFEFADAFLERCGKENDKIASAERRAEIAENSVNLLRNMNEDGQFGVRVALERIWEFLGVKNQTDAMQRLRDTRAALQGLVDHYTELVNSGDCGNWDPETVDEIIAARRVLP